MLVSLYIHDSFFIFFYTNFQNFSGNTREKLAENKQKLSNGDTKQAIQLCQQEKYAAIKYEQIYSSKFQARR